jgi:predicted ribosome-associated RNA-binding protein Tma20
MEDRTGDSRVSVAQEGVIGTRKMVPFYLSDGCALCLTHSDSSRDHITIYTVQGEPLFFQHFDGPFYPTLRLVHKCM